MDQGQATFTFLACHSEMQICQGKGKPRGDGLFSSIFMYFPGELLALVLANPDSLTP